VFFLRSSLRSVFNSTQKFSKQTKIGCTRLPYMGNNGEKAGLFKKTPTLGKEMELLQ
jgi:hypothetical protein